MIIIAVVLTAITSIVLFSPNHFTVKQIASKNNVQTRQNVEAIAEPNESKGNIMKDVYDPDFFSGVNNKIYNPSDIPLDLSLDNKIIARLEPKKYKSNIYFDQNDAGKKVKLITLNGTATVDYYGKPISFLIKKLPELQLSFEAFQTNAKDRSETEFVGIISVKWNVPDWVFNQKRDFFTPLSNNLIIKKGHSRRSLAVYFKELPEMPFLRNKRAWYDNIYNENGIIVTKGLSIFLDRTNNDIAWLRLTINTPSSTGEIKKYVLISPITTLYE